MRKTAKTTTTEAGRLQGLAVSLHPSKKPSKNRQKGHYINLAFSMLGVHDGARSDDGMGPFGVGQG